MARDVSNVFNFTQPDDRIKADCSCFTRWNHCRSALLCWLGCILSTVEIYHIIPTTKVPKRKHVLNTLQHVAFITFYEMSA